MSLTPDHPPDDLVERARRLDPAAVRELVQRSVPFVEGCIRRYFGSSVELDELFQDVIENLLRSLPRLREPARYWSCLRSIVLNRGRDMLKARRRQRTDPHEDMDCVPPENLSSWGAPLVSLPTAPDIVAADHELVEHVERALSALEPELRQVWWLNVEGYTRSQCAAMLALPEGTVAGRLRRARERLAKLLSRRGGPWERGPP